MKDMNIIRLGRIFREVLDDATLEITEAFSTKEHPEWDSVAMVQIVLAVEEEFGVQLGMESVARIKSAGDILALIEK
jgi:acyl carrier protein